MTDGQRLAIEQLREIESAGEGALEIISVGQPADNGAGVIVEISIFCKNMTRAPEGLPLRTRECFILIIPADFPFTHPFVLTIHTRFAGFPHVQWKRHLCLYQAPSTEWSPTDGMYGFIGRFDEWLKKAALGQLDPFGAPLHPPVAYRSSTVNRTVIPRVNTPIVGDRPWFGFAHLKFLSEVRIDVCRWSDITEKGVRPVGAAILLANPFPFEFPGKVIDLLEELAVKGIPRDLLFLVLQAAVLQNDEGTPLYFFLGTPMRGIRGSESLKQHLAVWHIDPILAKALRLALEKYSSHDEIRKIGEDTEQIIIDWAKAANVDWCTVREDRPEIVTRRDHDAPLSWFQGRVVSLWGCGALGGHIAEALVRAGVGKLILRDDGTVAPGLLARQPFDDHDIGRPKVEALAERLKRIRPDDLAIEIHSKDILNEPLGLEAWTEDTDLIIDTTASQSVLEKLEFLRCTVQPPAVPMISMAIGHRAERGLAVLVRPEYSGGPLDAVRRAKLEACNQSGCGAFLEEFWPKERHSIFQPEPGCSDATFIGSLADVTALTGMMLNLIARDLFAANPATACAHFVAQPHATNTADQKMHFLFSWLPDHVISDPHSDYEVRIADSAWKEIVAWMKRSERVHGSGVETGGFLFGERNDASKIIWISEVTGPPPDSVASEDEFICGVSGMAEVNEEKRRRTRQGVQFIGTWHTHPDSVPLPSRTDLEGMRKIVNATDPPSPKSLLLIIGGFSPSPAVGAFVFTRAEFKAREKGVHWRSCSISTVLQKGKPRRIGLALSGGGSRAIAFHLGCLRALHDRGLLDQVEVLSAVSGGSVIAAMYAYSDDSFTEFEARVIDLLRRGLVGGILRHALLSRKLFGSLGTTVTAGSAAIGAYLLRSGCSLLSRVFGGGGRGEISWIDRIQPPLPRWVNRTTAFEAFLREALFGDRVLTDKRRGDIDIVINACELRTGSAFRFGSRESGCWRYGRVAENNIGVAHAVATSAAYPVLLPAVDRIHTFIDRDENRIKQRVVLTDGGIFDNLGVTCMEPGRSAEISCNVFQPEYIVCCDAGAGLFSDHVYPYWWSGRMVRSFEAVFRKTLNAAYERLHRHVASGALKGFALAYLGQQDQRLPYIPPDLVRRDEVFNYPTDFSPMRFEDIERISARGEQLMRLLIAQYCQKL